MLLAINDRIKGWLGGFIIGLIALTFSLWGIQSYIGGADEQIAASIDDREISIREVDQAASVIRQNLQNNNAKMPDDAVLKRNALEQIINNAVLDSQSYEQGYRISDGVLASNVQNLFSRDGKFDKDYFMAALASQGMTAQSFEQRYRGELRVQQQRDAIISSAIVNDDDVKRVIQMEDQQRELTWLKLNIDKLAGDIAVSDEEIEEYYNTREHMFRTPQEVSVDYIELNADTVDTGSVDVQQLHSLYEDYVATEKLREQRKARHILISTADDKGEAKDKITALQQQLSQGGDFASLAKQHSQDTGSADEGGDLGWVETGQMVKPFEDALFKLAKGDISKIVETEFGYHLIKLDDVRSVDITSFEEKRAELEQQLKQEAVDNALYELSEIMASTAYENPDSLEPVAEALGQDIKSSEMFRENYGAGIAQHAVIRKAAFSELVLKQGENSELIEVEPGHLVVLRVKENKESTPVPLETVKNTIQENIRLSKGQQAVTNTAESVIEQLKQGATIDAVVADGISNEGDVTISKTSMAGLDRFFVNTVLTMPIPVTDKPNYKHIKLATGDVAVVILNKVTWPEDIDQSEFASVKAQFRQVRALEDFGALLNSYRNKASVYINEKALTQE